VRGQQERDGGTIVVASALVCEGERGQNEGDRVSESGESEHRAIPFSPLQTQHGAAGQSPVYGHHMVVCPCVRSATKADLKLVQTDLV
jgi:hypothetical protein